MGAASPAWPPRYQLDIPAALENFREAFEIGTAVGPHSHAARLAGSLLGELLYETGDLAEATRLMDESYLLGSDGGGVDYLAARYVIGARIKEAQGDHDSAVDRLAAGAKAADHLRLPRLAARINNERIRLGIELPQAVAGQSAIASHHPARQWNRHADSRTRRGLRGSPASRQVILRTTASRRADGPPNWP